MRFCLLLIGLVFVGCDYGRQAALVNSDTQRLGMRCPGMLALGTP